VHPSADTIVAAATAAGAAGLAVVRVAGPEALAIGGRLFEGACLADSASHRAHHGWVRDAGGERIDEVLALVLRAPHGYTGEDTVEFSCHGGTQIVDEVVGAALAAGCRLAEPGEFTRRAFLNGKLDLCQAEAVADLIAAQSRAGRRAALLQLRGALSERLGAVRGDLLELLADVEASIDFVEEGHEFFDRRVAGERAAGAAQRVAALLATAADGVLLRTGVRASFAGAPNVGKSSVFNRLLEMPRSIVTEHPGTTRDVVRELLHVGGLALALEDTAGLRDAATDPVEQLGIERSRRSHAEADIVLFVLDASRAAQPQELAAIERLDPEAALVVLNKIDLVEGGANAAAARREFPGLRVVAVSAASGAGIDSLLEALAELGKLRRLGLQNDALVTIAPRHREALLRAGEGLETLRADLASGEPPEILAASLRAAVLALGEVSGENVTEEVLDSIFARFCIGK
jgi:tRNA modification GTPase